MLVIQPGSDRKDCKESMDVVLLFREVGRDTLGLTGMPCLFRSEGRPRSTVSRNSNILLVVLKVCESWSGTRRLQVWAEGRDRRWMGWRGKERKEKDTKEVFKQTNTLYLVLPYVIP